MQTKHFTKVQISELVYDLMEFIFESMMLAERGKFLHENPQNKDYGFHLGYAYDQERKLFRIPCDCYGSNFHSPILVILCNQEEKWTD